MKRTMINHTQITVTMQLETDTPVLEILLVWLALVLWQLRLIVKWARYEWVMFWQDFKEAADFTGKVFAIAFNSWAWALGVKA